MRLRRAAEALLLVALVVAPWPYGSAGDVWRFALVAVLYLATATWAVGRTVAGEASPGDLIPVAAAAVALPLVQVALGRTEGRIATLEAALVLGAFAGAAVLAADLARDPTAARRLVAAVLVACTAQAVFGVVQWSRAPATVYGRATPYVTMPFGSFVNHNHFAGLVGMAVVLAAGLAIAAIRRARAPTPAAIVLAGLALGLATAHLASRSRGGLVALVGGLTVLVLLTIRRARAGGRPRVAVRALAAVSALGVLAFAWAAVPAATRAHLATALRGRATPSGQYRVDIAAATLRLAATHPLLGCGLGAYADAVTAFKRTQGDVRTVHAESDALELLAEAGLAGLAVLTLFIRTLHRATQERLRSRHAPPGTGRALAAAAAAATLLIHSLWDFNLHVPANALAFAVLIGVATSPVQPRLASRRRLYGVLAAGALLLGVASAWRAAGARSYERATTRSDPQDRIEALTLVLRHHPYLPEAYRDRATIWRDLAWRPPEWVATRLARAGADLERALALRPAWSEAWTELGWVRFFAGEGAGAREAMDRAATLDPTRIDIGVARADLLGRTGDVDAAFEQLRRLQGVHPAWTMRRALALASRWTRDPRLLMGLTGGAADGAALVEEALRNAPAAP